MPKKRRTSTKAKSLKKSTKNSRRTKKKNNKSKLPKVSFRNPFVLAVFFALIAGSVVLGIFALNRSTSNLLLLVDKVDAIELENGNPQNSRVFPDGYLLKDGTLVCRNENESVTTANIDTRQAKNLIKNLSREKQGASESGNEAQIGKYTRVYFDDGNAEEFKHYDGAVPGLVTRAENFFKTECKKATDPYDTAQGPGYTDPLETDAITDEEYDSTDPFHPGEGGDLEETLSNFIVPKVYAQHDTEAWAVDQYKRINSYRRNRGRDPLYYSACLNYLAQRWSATMARNDRLYHSPWARDVDKMNSVLKRWCGGNWRVAAENVGRTSGGGKSGSAGLFSAFTKSADHNANLLKNYGAYGRPFVGTGAAKSGSTTYVTQLYAVCSSGCAAPWYEATTRARFYLNNHLNKGGTEYSFKHGKRSDTPMMCDVTRYTNRDFPVVYKGNAFFFRTLYKSAKDFDGRILRAGRSHKVVRYGRSGDQAFCGDWNGDGIDTIGVRRGTRIYVRNSNSPGRTSASFNFGSSSRTYQVVVGDWNNNGRDSIALYDPGPSVFHFSYGLNGSTNHKARYGSSSVSYDAIGGNWNGRGRDGMGLERNNSSYIYLRNGISSGVAHYTQRWGSASREYKPVAGDWNNNGRDSVGLFR